jgi:hypothetical protein
VRVRGIQGELPDARLKAGCPHPALLEAARARSLPRDLVRYDGTRIWNWNLESGIWNLRTRPASALKLAALHQVGGSESLWRCSAWLD